MAARKTTPWRAATWERSYRGETIWIELMYSRSPKWEWTAGNKRSRAATKLTAMRAAERAVDRDIAALQRQSAAREPK